MHKRSISTQSSYRRVIFCRMSLFVISMVTVDICCSRDKVTATPWAGSLQGHIERPTLAFSHTPTDHSEFPVDLTCMFLDNERKPENVQRVRVRVRNQTSSLLSEAAALTTAPPCCSMLLNHPNIFYPHFILVSSVTGVCWSAT